MGHTASAARAYYFAIGDHDGYDEFVRACQEFATLLRAQAPRQLDWSFELLPGEDHMSAAGINFREGLRFVFGDPMRAEVGSPAPNTGPRVNP